MSNGHRVATLSFTVTLSLAGVVALLWLLGGSTPSAHADSPHYVTSNCTGVPDPCHTSIQAAVDAASPGDVIKVATGVYSDVNGCPAPPGYPNPPTSGIITQVVYISKTVTIQGGYTITNWSIPYPISQPTTLDAQGQGRVILIAGYISPTIEGLHITGGDAAGLSGWYMGEDVGGGVYVDGGTVIIRNNWVFNNTAFYGGGLFLAASAATLGSNTVSSNIADYGGGLDVYDGEVMLTANTIVSNNAAVEGGGLFLYDSDATLNADTVISNTAYYGGGLFLYDSDATLNDSTVAFNTADRGGGLFLYYSAATLTNTVVADNQAGMEGSGLFILAFSPRLLHTTIARNSGGDGSGVYVTDDGFNYSTVALTNTILVSHTVGITVKTGNTARLESTLWHGNTKDWDGAGYIFTGTHNYRGDPRFAADGYHLLAGSAAIDKGVGAGVTTDIDGESRDSAPDLGADEWAGSGIYLPIILKNASP